MKEPLKNQTIGFVGLGQMGYPIARTLVQAGFPVRVFDVREERIAPLVALGAIPAACLAEVVEPGGVVISMVPGDTELCQIALNDPGIVRQLGPGGLHLSLSTISPDVVLSLTKYYATQGVALVAATVSGRPEAAATRQLSVYVSGNAAAKDHARPILETIGSTLYDLGPAVESAVVMKLAANYLILAALVAMGSAATFVERHGLERELFLRAMRESVLFQGSAVYAGYGRMIGALDYSDENFSTALGLKDASLIVHEAERLGLKLPVAQQAYDALLAAQAAGHGKQSWAVLAEYAEKILEDHPQRNQ
ncbi:NAD(P)-dependent oxidoreductase [Dictyobacter arantiisoli]|uniref:Oxidoreductase n=1 Tax=Dictyobacter arantiisoli TaxID=2014874 RepID=A0A5A5TIS3_9CHLR|nr:NAD(P)-dependent oxidoreductase [Dictyobacter arantiisoli]GCF11232.1 oxidoreductase [Dictyobacter arantiisoli]